MRLLSIINSIIFCILSITAMSQPMDRVQTIDQIIGRVNDQIILKSDLEMAKIQYRMSGVYVGEEMECEVLEGIAVNKMLLAKAEIDSIKVEEDMVENYLDNKIQQYLAGNGMTEQDLLNNYGKSIEDFKNEWRSDMRDQLVVQKMQNKITEDVIVTPHDVRQFFAKIPVDSLPYFSTSVIVGHIVRKARPSANRKEETWTTLEQIKIKIQSGEDFEDYVYLTEDLASKETGGDIGDFCKGGGLVPAYEQMALKLKEGEMGIVETQFGIHLIQLISRNGNCFRSRHILMKPKIGLTDLDAAKAFLDTVKFYIDTDSLSFEEAAIKYSDDDITKLKGGKFNDKAGDIRISTNELDPAIYFMIEEMSPGQITKPLNFKTANNESAARIVYYEKKIPAHLANLEIDWQKIKNATLQAKRTEALNDWFYNTVSDLDVWITPDYGQCKIFKKDF